MLAPMLRVGLTGGIGSGKSTVAALLAEHGAVVVDADALAHEALQPGQPAVPLVVAAFGNAVLSPDGSIDRSALAGLVFSDAEALGRLEAIVHPDVATRAAAAMAAAPADAIVVYDVPLLAEKGMGDQFDAVVVVTADQGVRLKRLVDRGMAASDAARRIAAQTGDADRRAVADLLIDNAGDLDELTTQVEAAWAWLVARSEAAR